LKYQNYVQINNGRSESQLFITYGKSSLLYKDYKEEFLPLCLCVHRWGVLVLIGFNIAKKARNRHAY